MFDYLSGPEAMMGATIGKVQVSLVILVHDKDFVCRWRVKTIQVDIQRVIVRGTAKVLFPLF